MAIPYQKAIDRQLGAIKEAMQQFPNGASSEEIKAAAELNIELRTVQRRLGELIERGELRLSGQTYCKILSDTVRENPGSCTGRNTEKQLRGDYSLQ